ncbi:hypothetical protein [Streptodolium elevatio]|uniref:Uncharacterized protein n=1 Tax=Streptodolium elevatio TaxID=3157996 RepID=A0ABV3DT06_9ACTN
MGGGTGGTTVARVVAPRQAATAKATGAKVTTTVATGASAVVSRAVARHRSRPIPRQALGAARLLAAGRIAVGVVQAVAPHAAGRLLPARPAGVGDASALSRGLGVRDTVVAAGWWHALDRGGKGAAEWAWLQVAADVSDGAGTVGRWRALDRREKAWMVVLGALAVADAAVAVALGGADDDTAGTIS